MTSQRSIIFLLLCSALMSADASDVLCKSGNRTCSFGGTCNEIPGISGPDSPFLCQCVDINCFQSGKDFDPVCDHQQNTHLNDACRRVNQCTLQKNLNPVCKGICGQENCIPVEPLRRCRAEEANLCLNYGECLLSETGTAYCDCLPNYFGPRCEFRIGETRKKLSDCVPASEGVDYRAAFLTCLGILGLVLLLQVTYCIIKCHSSHKKQKLEKTSFTNTQPQDEGEFNEPPGPGFTHLTVVDMSV